MKIVQLKHMIYFSLLIGMIGLIIACATNPVTGKKEFMLVTESDEIQMGAAYDPQITSSYGLYDNPEVADYIESIGQQMVKLSHRPELQFHFRLLDTPVINAFAVPGGYVYITRGILAYLNNEAELAGVIGHEIGHITARHSAKQISTQQVAQIGLGAGMILSEDFRKFAGLAQAGVGMLFLRFSRDNERQSDDLGVEYSTKAGYDSREMANFFTTLDKMSPDEQQGGLPGWFSTHPNPADRVPAVLTKSKEWQAKVGSQNVKINRDAYLRKIDGIVFGEDPRQGYFENNMFYHPDLKFQFPVPAGWETINTPTQVQMSSQEQNAILIFQLAKGTSPAEAANQFVSENQARVISNESKSVNGLSAQKVVSVIASEQSELQVMSYFIRKDANIFAFHGVTDAAGFAKNQTVFETTMGGFKNLSDPKKLNVKPARLQIKTISRTTTLRDALVSFGVAEEKLSDLALMNGMELGNSLPANSLIKIIEK
jgi:predicted Zn-dependent protease